MAPPSQNKEQRNTPSSFRLRVARLGIRIRMKKGGYLRARCAPFLPLPFFAEVAAPKLHVR